MGKNGLSITPVGPLPLPGSKDLQDEHNSEGTREEEEAWGLQ